MSGIKIAELFAGAGLIGGGFKAAGFQSIFAADLDHRAISTYNSNIEPVGEVWDAKNVKVGLDYDVLVAGPPCQGFSTLGRRDPKDERNSLSLLISDWAEAHQPKVIVIENVPQFVQSEYFLELKNRLEALGYSYIVWTLNAEDYGVAQRRMRCFIIFSTIGIPECPPKSSHKLTVRDAFRGLPSKPNGKNFHIAPEPTELALERMKHIPKLGDKRDVMSKAPDLCPPSWFKMGSQAVDVWGRMDWNKPSNTVRCSFQAPSKGRYIHPKENRVITLREGARLQGIPDNWQFIGDRTSIARQIGNGVPVPLAYSVASSVLKLFER